MSWYEILAIISKLTELDKFTVESCASALGCQFEPTTPNRYRADALQNPFNFAELISGSDKTILILTLKSESAREEFAMRMHSLGKPIDIDVVSPPIADGNHPGTHSVWERKYSLCYEIGDCPVWFGIEEVNSRKNLVNVTIYRHQ